MIAGLYNENFKVIQNPGFLPDHAQNWITCSLCHARRSLKILERSVHNFSSYLAHTQTNRQTKSDKNITSLAEVITWLTVRIEMMRLMLMCVGAALESGRLTVRGSGSSSSFSVPVSHSAPRSTVTLSRRCAVWSTMLDSAAGSQQNHLFTRFA